jgi:hypothetical protein
MNPSFFPQITAIYPPSLFEVEALILRRRLKMDSSKNHIGDYSVATYEAGIQYDSKHIETTNK